MSDPDTIPAGIHQEIELLPWYLTGTLPEPERRQVAQHLESCTTCRSELDELTQIQRDLATIYTSQSVPSSQLARSVMAKVDEQARPPADQQWTPGSGVDRLDQWLRSLFLPQWAPTFVVMLLVAQTTLLVWIGIPSTNPDQVSPRSVGAQTARIVVTFHTTATVGQIQSLLQDLHGRIIAGPTDDGRYTIDVLATDPSATQRKIDVLKAQGDVVRSAEAPTP